MRREAVAALHPLSGKARGEEERREVERFQEREKDKGEGKAFLE